MEELRNARAATYLITRERLDARKTTRNVQCNPPNVRCGKRCIPPTWNCRLKGQGADPHLRAVKTDPLGGLASIQRGASRIAKGVTRGNFSEVEGGKRAVIRGAVKIAPGNIQQKKALQKKLEDRTRAIGIGLAVVTGGLGAHALFMKTDLFGYRNGAGANINNAVRLGVSRVLDATPVLGEKRARVRAAAQAGVYAELTRQANPVSAALTGQMARTRLTTAEEDARTNLVRALQAVNTTHGGARSDFDAWNRDHQQAFWSVTRVENGVGLTGDKRASVFARPATDEFLARQFNLRGDDVLTSEAVKDAITRQLGDYKSSLLDLAQQQGYRVTNTRAGGRALDEKDRRTFIQGVVRGALPPGIANDRIRSQLTTNLQETLANSPKGQSNAIYRDTFGAFNEFYTARASAIENAYSAPRINAEMRRTGVAETLLDAQQVRGQYVLGLVRPGSQVRGSAHAELALREYHARNVAGNNRSMYTVSDRLATAAASEIEGRTVGRTEALQILEREGFTGAVPRNPLAARGASKPQDLTGQTRNARRRVRSRGEIIAMLTRGPNGLSPEAAAAEADRIIARRSDEDDFSPEPVRTATYLAARADFQEGKRLGKPCGASHIPKAHECRKGHKERDISKTPSSPKSRLGQKIALASIVAVTGAVGVTVALDAHRFYNSRDLPHPPSYRETLHQLKKSTPGLKNDEAIGAYYDRLVSEQGWKPGELVYTRFSANSAHKDPTAHFAIYMGKQGAQHQFADFGVASASAREGAVNMYTYGPGSKSGAPFIFAKAPPLKRGRASFTPDQISQRVFMSLGSRMQYDALDNNCETWARMITTGESRSSQAERLSSLTRSIYRYYDRRLNGPPPKDVPSMREQAKILDNLADMASQYKITKIKLNLFQQLLNKRNRRDSLQANVEEELTSPADILTNSKSDVESILQAKRYLMLVISQGQNLVYGPPRAL